jgi:hypothetical protein
MSIVPMQRHRHLFMGAGLIQAANMLPALDGVGWQAF